MKGFFDKNIKSRSKDDRFEAALSFSPFDAFLSLKASTIFYHIVLSAADRLVLAVSKR